MGIDRRAAAEKGPETFAARTLNEHDSSPGPEYAVGLLQPCDALFGPHVRDQALLIVEHDDIERSVFKGKRVEIAAGLELQQDAAALCAAARAGGVGIR